MQGAKKQVDVESFVVCSVFCEQEEREALESALRQTSGVGATYIDMEQTFLVHGLWLMPKQAVLNWRH
jgi:hypothetical protein